MLLWLKHTVVVLLKVVQEQWTRPELVVRFTFTAHHHTVALHTCHCTLLHLHIQISHQMPIAMHWKALFIVLDQLHDLGLYGCGYRHDQGGHPQF